MFIDFRFELYAGGVLHCVQNFSFQGVYEASQYAMNLLDADKDTFYDKVVFYNSDSNLTHVIRYNVLKERKEC